MVNPLVRLASLAVAAPSLPERFAQMEEIDSAFPVLNYEGFRLNKGWHQLLSASCGRCSRTIRLTDFRQRDLSLPLAAFRICRDAHAPSSRGLRAKENMKLKHVHTPSQEATSTNKGQYNVSRASGTFHMALGSFSKINLFSVSLWDTVSKCDYHIG